MATTAAKLKEAQTCLPLGLKVTVKGKSKGVVKFVGTTNFGAGVWVGVELEKPKGQHDGAMEGDRYFKCKPQHGVFALYEDVQALGLISRAFGALGGATASLVGTVRSRSRSKSPEPSGSKSPVRGFSRSASASSEDSSSGSPGKAAGSLSGLKNHNAFLAWNAMDMDSEAQHHEQAATQERVEAILRASHPNAAELPNEISATHLAKACGMTLDFLKWGSDTVVDADYEGPRIKFPVEAKNIAGVLHQIRSNPDYVVHKKFVSMLLGHACHQLASQKGVEYITVPPGGKVVVFGDTHGQLADFLLVLQRHGPPSEKVVYVINGDVADRGDNSLEILVIVVMYKLLHPNSVFMNRGNHENHDINRKPAEAGGGFYDEVVYKLDGAVFLMFQIFFEMLPLVTVINGQVAVMHGGIPRIEGLTLKRMSEINRRRQCPKVVQSTDDAILFDIMWADPQEASGISLAAQRGPNCRRFGPDVTKRFLSDNGLSLLIRSHEVPTTLRGFEERHERRLLTVFSASNYCGMAGNYGAIVVFDSEMSYTLEEYMAPDLDAMILEYTSSAEALQAAEASSEASRLPKKIQRSNSFRRQPDEAQSRERMTCEVLAKLEVKICQHKDDLWWFWKEIDRENTGMVHESKWREGMSSKLNLEIPWESLQDELASADGAGMVNYREFLHRIRNSAMAEGLKGVEGGWEKQMVVKVYESILRCDMSLKQTILEFDPDGDGMVSPWEFKEALLQAKVDIPEAQVAALLRMIDRDEKKLDVAKFLDRFQVVYSRAAEEGLTLAESVTGRKVRNMMTEVGKSLISLHGDSRIKIFERFDDNRDGFIQENEFYVMLSSLKLHPELSDSDKRDMWRYVDTNGDGHLNYFEFCAAFQVVDASEDSDAVNEIIETIVSTLQRNMSSLEFAFRFFDQEGQGHIPVDDFKAGIRALNSSIKSAQGRSVPLSEEQIEVLVQHVDTDGDGHVDYHEFCSAFRPKDERFLKHDGGLSPAEGALLSRSRRGSAQGRHLD